MSADGNYDIQLDGGELLESVIPQHVQLVQKTGPPIGRGNAGDAAGLFVAPIRHFLE